MKRFGGHKAAAGLQIETSRIKEFRQAVNAHADAILGPDDLRPSLWLDGPLAFHDINERVMLEFAALAPFGPGNPRPKFHTNGVAIVDGPRLLKERHLKMSVKQNGRVLRAIQWNAAEREPNLTAKKDGVEIAYTIEENEYQGTRYVELRLEDFR
jgi:single-stranded-DNA-specific exonuclease